MPIQFGLGTITRHKSSDITKQDRGIMIVDDNFTGIVMLALVGVIYLAYKVGEYVGEIKSDRGN